MLWVVYLGFGVPLIRQLLNFTSSSVPPFHLFPMCFLPLLTIAFSLSVEGVPSLSQSSFFFFFIQTVFHAGEKKDVFPLMELSHYGDLRFLPRQRRESSLPLETTRDNHGWGTVWTPSLSSWRLTVTGQGQMAS